MGHQYKNKWVALLLTVCLNICATGLAFLIQFLNFSEINIVIIYLLSVLVTSCFIHGYFYGISASILATLSFNFFFSQPVYSFNIEDKDYIVTFLVMLVAALITSTLTGKLIAMKELSRQREREANILYQISSSLSKTSGMREVAAVSMRWLSNFLEQPVDTVLLQDDAKQPQLLSYDSEGVLDVQSRSQQELEHFLRKKQSFPIYAEQHMVCLFCIPLCSPLPESEQALLDSILLQISIAMERELLNHEREHAKSEIRQERFKSQLLRAISHDLRTPLTAIAGSAEILMQETEDAEQTELAKGIYEDASWLARLVENILNLTRIQEKRLELQIQPEAVEEVVSSAVRRISKYAPEKRIHVRVPDELLFVPMDNRLIEQVLLNLMDNAVKHTPPACEITLAVRTEGNQVWFAVTDNGPGISEQDLPNLFNMFYMAQGQSTDARRGIGLGLAICKAIIEFHGGSIEAANTPEGGARFQFYLTTEGDIYADHSND